MSRLWERCDVLRTMLEEKVAYTTAGEMRTINSHIPPVFATALYETVALLAPAHSVEIGMAFGTSSLAILQALEDTGQEGARLVSIDPCQTKDWGGCGVEMVRRARLSSRHEFKQEFDYFALPDMLRAGEQLDFSYIDGWHTFDFTLLDFWYIDRMLQVGGVVAFNDCGFPAVDKVINFVQTHRKYRELDVGLPRLEMTMPGLRHEDRYFQKVEAFEPNWNFFAEF